MYYCCPYRIFPGCFTSTNHGLSVRVNPSTPQNNFAKTTATAGHTVKFSSNTRINTYVVRTYFEDNNKYITPDSLTPYMLKHA